MAANGGERTLIPAIIPPGAAHPNGVFSLGGDELKVVLAAGGLSSLISDFAVRAAPKSGIYQGVIERMPLPDPRHPLVPSLVLRTLRLNAMTEAYGPLWQRMWQDSFLAESWLLTTSTARPELGVVHGNWTSETPLRADLDRRNALVEIDALMATMLGVTADELCTIYRTQFAVLHGYDQNTHFYDANGRLVPTAVLQAWRKRGDAITLEDRTAVHPGSGVEYVYELPFANRDREADFREAMQAIARLDLS